MYDAPYIVVDPTVQRRLLGGLAARLKKRREKSAVRAVLRMIYKTEKARLARWEADKPACIQDV